MAIPALKRVDHLICEVSDIRSTLAHFHHELGFPVAWPVGRFWPGALTCGIGLGGLNLEFLQPNSGGPDSAKITSIVFEPNDLSALVNSLESHGIRYRLLDKTEEDSELLQMRGFSYEESQRIQDICTNVLPDVAQAPFPYFACQYSPFLQFHLSGSNARLQGPYGRVTALTLGMPQPERLSEILDLGYQGDVEIRALKHDTAEMLELAFEKGPVDLKGFKANFHF